MHKVVIKTLLCGWFMCLSVSQIKAQVDTLEQPLPKAEIIPNQPNYRYINAKLQRRLPIPKIEYPWKEVNKITADFSEVAFVNWNAGGVNSVSALFGLYLQRLYKKDFLRWNNEFISRYGINKQSGQSLRKTDDLLEINSTLGYRTAIESNWYYTGKFNFRTQYEKGFNNNDKETTISRFMAPGYLFLGLGAEYNAKNANFNFYGSPLTLKNTFVLDQRLANLGSFGVNPAIFDDQGNVLKSGQNVRTEFGVLLTNQYQAEIIENIIVDHRVSLYSDYLNNFGNIDINWELNFNFKVNSFVQARFGSHIIYDDDIKIERTNEAGENVPIGARVQWRQQLGIGVVLEI